MNPFVKKVSEYHLSTWFILPLIQLNKFSFGEANFVNSYVNAAGTIITVEMIDLRLCESFQNHPEYKDEKSTGKHSFIYFELPARWRTDFELFKAGKYSKMSDEAKELIIAHSGLKYQYVDEDNQTPITDARLMALERSDILREKWIDELSVHVGKYKSKPHISADAELLSVPSSETFMEFE